MQTLNQEQSLTVVITKEQISNWSLVNSILANLSIEDAIKLFQNQTIEPAVTIEAVEVKESIQEIKEPVQETKEVEPKKETTLERYARMDFERIKMCAKYNYERNGITIINQIADIPVLEKGDKGVKDAKKIDIKCAIAKVLGYYVKGKQVYSPHHKPLVNKITYKFKKNEANYGEQMQVEANDFKEYIIKLQFYKEFEANLKAEKELTDTCDTENEDEALNPIENEPAVVPAVEPTITYPYQLDSKAKKIKAGGGTIPACVGYYDLAFEEQNQYIQWWYGVGQKLLTTTIAEITI